MKNWILGNRYFLRYSITDIKKFKNKTKYKSNFKIGLSQQIHIFIWFLTSNIVSMYNISDFSCNTFFG